MALPAFLRNLDNRLLGDRLRGKRDPDGGDHATGGPDRTGPDRTGPDTTSSQDRSGGTSKPARKHDGVPTFLSVVYRISRLVFLLLALLLGVAVLLILAPANEMNSIVMNIFELAEKVAGPFKDVFTVMDPERMRIANYALPAGVYLLASVIVGKLPTGGSKRG